MAANSSKPIKKSIAQTVSITTVPKSSRSTSGSKSSKQAAATTTRSKPRADITPRAGVKTTKSAGPKSAKSTTSKTTTVKNPPARSADPALAVLPLPGDRVHIRLHTIGIVALTLIVLVVISAATFEFAYAGRIMPGVSADGISLAGLSPSAARSRLADLTSTYTNKILTVMNGNARLTIPVRDLAVTYNPAAVNLAYNYGRQGNLLNQVHQQLRTILGRPTTFADYNYSDDRLTPYILQVDDRVATPVENASLSFSNGHAQVTPAQAGNRLDVGALIDLVSDRLGATSTTPVTAPVYQLSPQISTTSLAGATSEADRYLATPLVLNYSGQNHTVDQATVVSWLDVGASTSTPFLQSFNLNAIYPPPATIGLSLSRTAVQAYIANLAQSLDVSPQNAILSMQNSQLAITTPSHDGLSLDQTSAVNAIVASLSSKTANRTIALSLKDMKAAVNETDLTSLGITQLISEGETYFPDSPPDRLINVRQGAARFNNVLLAPGEVFSFGALLGEVDASTGYVPELVIDGNHEDYQYGGGLCQVSTTAFRAALLAGLPINEREGHAFAISYYTWPYGVPGVDATIYYPEVDLKFTNDTGHYILIQTIMNGDDLKFDFYGTKTKYGVIRGPYFVSGSNDASQASHTVFYRDVDNLAGQVTKTDTFNTYYQPSTDFPVENTFN